ncbi:MAG TPA: pentapeptide repeat-containing protein [Pirellulaceae bacterium]|nr:pentapeptide repeat-containing protein [Pirellulaceae bacterium]
MTRLKQRNACASVVTILLSLILFAQVSCAPPGPVQVDGRPEPTTAPHTGPGPNLAGKELQGQDFVGQDLTGAVFDRCDLSGVRFQNCVLRNASFRGATLSRAWIGDCLAANADFTDAVINELEPRKVEADGTAPVFLSERQLKSTRSYKSGDLRGCLIAGNGEFDFSGADLRRATLVAGDFSRCEFTDACIEELTFIGKGITYLTQNESLNKSLNPSGDEYHGDRVLRGGGLTTAQIMSTRSYREQRLIGLSFRLANLSDGDFSGADFTASDFVQCDFTRTDFSDAVITDVQFRGCEIARGQIKSTWNYKHNRMQGVVLDYLGSVPRVRPRFLLTDGVLWYGLPSWPIGATQF